MNQRIYDLCVIGGGINGAGIAREAAGRGFSVALIEARDLAAATSSRSTKLIHGGLRYLEYYEFGLVRDSLREREILLKLAPHIIRPLKFILPLDKTARPAWMIKAGLFLYDRLGERRRIPRSRGVSLSGLGLKKSFRKGFSYYDCWADDARLVVLNAISAAEKDATIFTYTKCTKLEEDAQGWIVHLDGAKPHIRAKRIINATGPWVKTFLKDNALDEAAIPEMRLVKGSHIIVNKQYEGDHAFLLQQQDGRIVFTIPYEGDFTLVGTTEENFSGDAYEAFISDEEKDYLCAAFNRAFTEQISSDDVLWHYSGVRPLIEDGSDEAKSVTRDYKLHRHGNTKHPMISVLGGKLTTYRILSEKCVDMMFPSSKAWSCSEALPGGDIKDFDQFATQQKEKYSKLPGALVERYARSYGTKMNLFCGGDLGEHYGDDVYKAEIDYLIKYEFAKTAEDILWRRSKLGLHVSDQTRDNLEKRFA